MKKYLISALCVVPVILFVGLLFDYHNRGLDGIALLAFLMIFATLLLSYLQDLDL